MTEQAPASNFQYVVNFLSLAAVVAIGGLVVELSHYSDLQFQHPLSGPNLLPQFSSLDPAVRHEADQRFTQGVALLHAKQYDYAVTALSQVVALVPNMPEAYVNLGFALLGLEQYERAGEYFNQATILRPQQTNAYWGLANALEGLEDYEGALGAMRSFIHLSKADDPFLTRARSALWEYEALLGRIPGVKVANREELQQLQNNPMMLQGGGNWQQGHDAAAGAAKSQ